MRPGLGKLWHLIVKARHGAGSHETATSHLGNSNPHTNGSGRTARNESSQNHALQTGPHASNPNRTGQPHATNPDRTGQNGSAHGKSTQNRAFDAQLETTRLGTASATGVTHGTSLLYLRPGGAAQDQMKQYHSTPDRAKLRQSTRDQAKGSGRAIRRHRPVDADRPTPHRSTSDGVPAQSARHGPGTQTSTQTGRR